jgi:L-asparaginase II
MERRNPFVPVDAPPLPSEGERPLEVLLARGGSPESRHRVHALLCDSKGRTLKRWGSEALTFFPRSSIKLIQALAWVDSPASAPYGTEELAIACGSHHGEPRHVEVVSRWLARLSLEEKDLECGAHDPYDKNSAKALARAGLEPCQLHNNCSGKHCGLLTACVASGWDTAGYTNYDHPVQERIRRHMSLFTDTDFSGAPWGIDGCGIPTYSLSLKSLALAMARVADPSPLDSQIQEAVRKLCGAIAERPLLIGGTDSFSSKVVSETEGRVFAKVGAEGVYGAWIPALGAGLALKCEDGNPRASEAALVAILGELGFPLGFSSPLARRWTGEVVGQFICG